MFLIIAILCNVSNYDSGHKLSSKYDVSTLLLQKEVQDINLTIDELKYSDKGFYIIKWMKGYERDNIS